MGYASGKNFETFIQFIDNGMYTLTLNEGKTPTGNNDDESDNDSEVLGEVIRKTPLGKQIRLVDDNCIVESKMGENNDNEIEEVIAVTMDSWKPFNSVKPPQGYCFFGKFAFLCYGPTSEYFSETLSSKGSQVTTLVDKKKMGRAAMLKETTGLSKCESRCWWE